jgi:hypothetical protein
VYQNHRMRLAAAFLLILLLPAALSFAVDGRINVHTRITRDALPFLRSALIDEIAKANKGEDHGREKNLPERHFMNCLVTASVAHINARYRATAGELFKGNSRNAAGGWGQVLHTVQDFYSHSAWSDSAPVGLALGGARGRNLESGSTWWSLPGPYERLIDDVVIVEGDPPPGITVIVPRDSQAKPMSVVPVVTIDGRRYRGLMTATTDPISFATARCPPAGQDCWDEETVCVRHGEPRREPKQAGRVIACFGSTNALFENCFHHDDPRRPQYGEAFAAALRQTRHEWCRLLHLSRETDSSLHSVSLLLGLWVAPPDEREALAMPHPVGTACAPSEPGRISVAIRVTAVSDSTAEHYAAVIYTHDLQRSARAQFKRAQLPGAPLALCIDQRDALVVTGWGWEGGKDFDPEDSVTGVSSRLPSEELPAVGATVSRAVIGRNGMRMAFDVSRLPDGCSA